MVAKGSSLRKHPMGRRFHGAVLAKGEGRDSYLPNEGNVQGPGELDTSVSLCNSNAPTAELSSRFWAAGRIVSYPVFTSRMPGSVLGTRH